MQKKEKKMGWLNLCVCGAKTIGYEDQDKPTTKKSRKKSGKVESGRAVIADDIQYEKCEEKSVGNNEHHHQPETKRIPKMGKLGRNDAATTAIITTGTGNSNMGQQQIVRPKMGTYNKRLLLRNNDHVPADDICYENLKFRDKEASQSDDDILRSEKAEGIVIESHGKLWTSENAVNEQGSCVSADVAARRRESSDELDSLDNSLDSLTTEDNKGSKEMLEVFIVIFLNFFLLFYK